MSITRRSALTLLGATLAAPGLLRANPAQAAATLTRLGGPIFLGAGRPGSNYGVSLAAFPNPVHGFIAAWISRNPPNSKSVIQYFGSDATPLSAPIEMSGPAGTTDGTFPNGIFPIARSDGSALILFSSKNDLGDEADFVDIFSQRMSAARTKVGKPALINTLKDFDQAEPLGVRLSNGNFLAVWTSALAGQDSIDVRGRVITFDGVGVTNDLRFNPDVSGVQRARSVAALAGGKSVVSYSSLVGSNWFLRAVVLNPNGTRARSPLQLQKVPSTQTLGSAAVVAKAPNQDKWLAVGYQIAAGASQAGLFFQEFDGIARSGPNRVIGGTFTRDDRFLEKAPNACMAGPDLVFVQHYGVSNNKPSVEGIVIDLTTRTVTAPRIAIHRSGSDTASDALIRLSQQQVYVSGFSDGNNTDVSTAKAAIQLVRLNLS